MVDIFLSDLDYNTPRCRQNIVCVESEVIGSDRQYNQNYVEPVQFSKNLAYTVCMMFL